MREADPVPALGDLTVEPRSAARHRAAGWWRDETIVDDLARAVAAAPDKVAIVGRRADGARRAVGYGELGALVDRVAGGLLDLGVAPGHVVSIQLPNWWEFVVLHLACARIGAVTNPITPILREREVGHIVRRAHSRLLVVAARHRGFDFPAMADAIAGTAPSLRHVVLVGAGDSTRGFDALLCRPALDDLYPSAVLDDLRPAADSAAQLQFTSGTTGPPKGVVHTHNSMYAGIRVVPDALGLDDRDVVLMASTLGHQTGFYFGCCMPVMYGMTVVLQDVWDPDAMLDIADAEGVTWTSAATPFVLDACAAAERRGSPPASLRLVRTSGAPVPSGLARRTRASLGAELIPSWGLTETGVCTIARPRRRDTAAAEDDVEETGAGAPVPWAELRIADERGQPVQAGRAGRVLVRGAGLFGGYLPGTDAGQAPEVPPEWFDTGDLGRLDGSGRLHITGRIKDLIVRGGENLPVGEIEELLSRDPAVREVALIGVPDPRLGERACAVVAPAPGAVPTLEGLTAALARAGVARHFWPEQLELVAELPRTAAGKVPKHRLRRALLGVRDR